MPSVKQERYQKIMFSAILPQMTGKIGFFLWAHQTSSHIPDAHNYEAAKCRSILTHNDPQNLLSTFAGKGQPKGKITPGNPGYVEKVDFGEVIGYYIHESNPSVKFPTTKATIKYSKNDAHIVPSHPDGWIFMAIPSDIRLSLQRALLDVITPSLRRVCYEMKNHNILLHFFYDIEISELERELASNAAAEVIADFPKDYAIDWKLERIGYPYQMPFAGHIVYNRYEGEK